MLPIYIFSGVLAIDPNGRNVKIVHKVFGKSENGMSAPETNIMKLSLIWVAAQHPFFMRIANPAKIKSIANPRDADKHKLTNAKIPLIKLDGAMLNPKNIGIVTSIGSEKQQNIGTQYLPIVSEMNMEKTCIGRVYLPTIDPSHNAEVAGVIMSSCCRNAADKSEYVNRFSRLMPYTSGLFPMENQTAVINIYHKSRKLLLINTLNGPPVMACLVEIFTVEKNDLIFWLFLIIYKLPFMII